MSAYLQDHRLLAIDTVLGANTLLVTAVRGQDALSSLFEIEVDLLSDSTVPVDPTGILGTSATVHIGYAEGDPLPLNGIVRAFEWTGRGPRGHRFYRATLVPKLWLLTKSQDCRIFQQKTTRAIVEAILTDFGITEHGWALTGSDYQTREYCVQYRETAWNFISRLLEEEGISFFFTHRTGAHKLMFIDSNRSFASSAGDPLSLTPQAADHGGISQWEHAFRLRSASSSATDYNFQTPSADLRASEQSVIAPLSRTGCEIFEFPGNYAAKGAGQTIARRRIEVEEAGYHEIAGESAYPELSAGQCFTLDKLAPTGDADAEFVVTAIDFTARDPSLFAGGGEAANYSNRFRCIPRKVSYRPERRTPKPLIHGLQTALVTGAGGTEICTDSFGRIKVQFHWDRRGRKDDASSCWIRVAQGWAGKGWGSWFVPRIGQEVVVSFLEGDPDRPLVIGSVHNAEQMPPFPLPGSATQSGIRTRSSMGGSAANCNEFRFEDAKGGEQVYLHAERNLDSSVELDETHSVGHDRSKTIGNNETVKVGVNRTETVGSNETISIGANRSETVGSNETISIGANRSETVGSNETIMIGANRTETVGSNEGVTIGAARTHTIGSNDTLTVAAARTHTVGATETITVALARAVTVGAAQAITVGADQAVTVGGAEVYSVGSSETYSVGGSETHSVGGDRTLSITGGDTVSVGKTLSITAADEIVLQTGSATLTMKKNGDITIEGKAITIKGSGDVIIKGQKILQN